MASRFRRTRLTSSLAQQQRGTPDGVFRLAPEIERVIADQIERFWLKKEKPKFSRLIERNSGTCLAEGLHPPHYRTVRRRVMDLTPVSASRKRGERDIETAVTPSPYAIGRIFGVHSLAFPLHARPKLRVTAQRDMFRGCLFLCRLGAASQRVFTQTKRRRRIVLRARPQNNG
jgi:hypothetical protein